MNKYVIALMRVFPKAIVLTTKSHFHVKRTYAAIRGLVVRTITSGKTCISAIDYPHEGAFQNQYTTVVTRTYYNIKIMINYNYYTKTIFTLTI